MKALAIQQPYAWLITNGYRKFEVRSWPTQYRGPFLVHATKAIDRPEEEYVRNQMAEDGRELPDPLDHGGIVGVVTLVDCRRLGEKSRFDRFLDRLFGSKSSSDDLSNEIFYEFILENPRPLPFVPYRGQQKFFNVPDDLFGPEIDL